MGKVLDILCEGGVNIPSQFYLTHYLIQEGVCYCLGRWGSQYNGWECKIQYLGGLIYHVRGVNIPSQYYVTHNLVQERV